MLEGGCGGQFRACPTRRLLCAGEDGRIYNVKKGNGRGHRGKGRRRQAVHGLPGGRREITSGVRDLWGFYPRQFNRWSAAASDGGLYLGRLE